MKRRLFLTGLALVFVLALGIGLTGCGDDSSTDTDSDTAAAEETMQYEGLNLDDYLTVGKYKGLKVKPYKIKVSEQEIQEKVADALDAATEHKDIAKGKKLKKGDTANIDYSGKIDGKEFDGGSSEQYELELGSGTFIEGFEEGLIGKKVGDTVDLELTFPKDYAGEEVAGKDVVFTVTINSATRPEKPEYTQEFVKANTDYDSKKAYEDSLEKEIYAEKEAEAKKEQKTNLWSDVLDDTKVKEYPEAEVAEYTKVFSAQVDTMAEQAGMTREDVIKQYYGAKSEKEFKSIVKDSVKTLVKQEMLVEYIANKEGLSYTDEEKENLITQMEGQGYTEETVKSYTGRTMDQYAHIQLLYEKVQDFILDNAKVKGSKK